MEIRTLRRDCTVRDSVLKGEAIANSIRIGVLIGNICANATFSARRSIWSDLNVVFIIHHHTDAISKCGLNVTFVLSLVGIQLLGVSVTRGIVERLN